MSIATSEKGILRETDNPEIAKAQIYYKMKLAELEEAEKKLKKTIVEEQKKCCHDWQKVEAKESNRIFSPKILVSIFCPKCFATKTKPEGSDYQICKYCWTEMKDDGIMPGQGSRVFCYKCPNCRHEEHHT